MIKIGKKTFDEYFRLVELNTKRNNYLSEDTIRYLFYLSLLTTVVDKNLESSTRLEMPFYKCVKEGLIKKEVSSTINKKNRCSLDTYIEIANEKYALEFKYHHKESMSGKNKIMPHAINSGGVFNDLFRLSIFNNNINKYFIYLSDETMIDKYKVECKDYVYRKLIENKIIKVVEDDFKDIKYKTFNAEAKKFENSNNILFNDYVVEKIYNKSFENKGKKYYLFIYSVK